MDSKLEIQSVRYFSTNQVQIKYQVKKKNNNKSTHHYPDNNLDTLISDKTHSSSKAAVVLQGLAGQFLSICPFTNFLLPCQQASHLQLLPLQWCSPSTVIQQLMFWENDPLPAESLSPSLSVFWWSLDVNGVYGRWLWHISLPYSALKKDSQGWMWSCKLVTLGRSTKVLATSSICLSHKQITYIFTQYTIIGLMPNSDSFTPAPPLWHVA